MKVESWRLERVIPYDRNPRDNSGAVAKVAASLKEFGWQQPLVVDVEGVLIVGHTRLLAAQQLGFETVPVVVARELSATQVKAYRLADNRTHEEATWIDGLLGEELRELDLAGFDLRATGFEDREIAKTLSAAVRSAIGGENDAPPVPKEPVARLGDRWLLGDHVLYCGDSTVAEDVAALYAEDRPSLMVTDPPYGVEYDASWRIRAGVSVNEKKSVAMLAVGAAAWKLFPGRAAYVWCACVHLMGVAESLQQARFEIRAQIVWVKDRFALGRGHYHWQHEPSLYASRGKRSGFQPAIDFDRPEPSIEQMDSEQATAWYAAKGTTEWQGSRSESTVWFIPAREDDGHGHPTQKPVECMLRPMLNNSRRGAVVYDPFLGSGTSLIAAEKAGRRLRAMELDPRFCDVAVERWQAFTGKKAKRRKR